MKTAWWVIVLAVVHSFRLRRQRRRRRRLRAPGQRSAGRAKPRRSRPAARGGGMPSRLANKEYAHLYSHISCGVVVTGVRSSMDFRTSTSSIANRTPNPNNSRRKQASVDWHNQSQEKPSEHHRPKWMSFDKDITLWEDVLSHNRGSHPSFAHPSSICQFFTHPLPYASFSRSLLHPLAYAPTPFPSVKLSAIASLHRFLPLPIPSQLRCLSEKRCHFVFLTRCSRRSSKSTRMR